MSERAITAVTFDLDGTLLEYERSPGEVLRQSYETLDIEALFPVQAYYDRYDEFTEQYDSLDTARKECFAALAAERGEDPQLGRAVAAAFAEERDQSRVKLLPGADRVLTVAADRYRTAIITNGAVDAQRAKITALGLDNRVDTVVVAGGECQPKPSPEPFERALDTLGVEPSKTSHVGDSLDTDVAGAAAAGMRSVWVGGQNRAEHEPTEAVDSTEQLLDLSWLEPAE